MENKRQEEDFRPIRTEDDIKEFIKGKDKAVIICWARWCPPCMRLREEFAELYKAFPYVSFGWLNVDSYVINLQNYCAAYLKSTNFSIEAVPSFVHFKKGKIEIIKGFDKMGNLIKELNNVL